jgi:hypothetical protein
MQYCHKYIPISSQNRSIELFPFPKKHPKGVESSCRWREASPQEGNLRRGGGESLNHSQENAKVDFNAWTVPYAMGMPGALALLN